MKTNDILSALALANTTFNKKHCTKLAAVYSLLKEIRREIVKAEIVKTNFPLKFGRHTEQNNGWNILVKNEGKEMISDIFAVTTDKGEYKFAVPCSNPFHTAICELLGIALVSIPAVKESPLKTISIPSTIRTSFGRAANFISQDNLRPAMQHICIAFDKGQIEIAATNAHWLYQSKKMDCSYNGKRLEILISARDAIKISQLKIEDEFMRLNFLTQNRIEIGGITSNTFVDGKFPDYRVVVPQYTEYVSFDRKNLVCAIKAVLPAANQSTSQVNFHINGSIALASGDVDFNYESHKEIAYLAKSIPDTDIAFNGKFFLKSLANFKDKELKMYSAGLAKKCVLISNDAESILLMPLMAL